MKKIINRIKYGYLSRFIKNEEGAEFLEIVLGIVLVIGLVAALIGFFGNMTDKINDASNLIDGLSFGAGGQPSTTVPIY